MELTGSSVQEFRQSTSRMRPKKQRARVLPLRKKILQLELLEKDIVKMV
jgi:hypothetical protein